MRALAILELVIMTNLTPLKNAGSLLFSNIECYKTHSGVRYMRSTSVQDLHVWDSCWCEEGV